MLETDQSPGWSSERAALWTAVFFLNLPVPMFLGLFVTSNRGGGFGMLVAVVAVWVTVLVLCGSSPRVGQVVIRGATVVAWSQLLPVLQVGAGVLAIRTWESAFGRSGTGSHPEVAGLGITLLTAMPLLFAALVVGGGHRLVLGSDVGDRDETGEHEVPGEDSSPAG